jgi:hypothetical protein
MNKKKHIKITDTDGNLHAIPYKKIAHTSLHRDVGFLFVETSVGRLLVRGKIETLENLLNRILSQDLVEFKPESGMEIHWAALDDLFLDVLKDSAFRALKIAA